MEYQDPKLPDLSSFTVILTLELDPEHAGLIHGQRPPAPLDRAAASRLLAHLGQALHRTHPKIEEVSLIGCAALYDLTEVIQPQSPLVQALQDIFRGTLVRGGFAAQQIALGLDASDEAFPIEVLNPRRTPGAGPLLLLPLLLMGRRIHITPLASNLEASLLQSGVVDDETIALVADSFGLRGLVNVSWATLNDLTALLKVQLENAGFETLWTILENALFDRKEVLDLYTEHGLRLLAQGDQVWLPFQTFDDYAAACETPANAETYTRWLQDYRQYSAALAAHGLDVQRILAPPGLAQSQGEAAIDQLRGELALDGGYVAEVLHDEPETHTATHYHITHHRSRELGTLAWTVLGLDETGQQCCLLHYYPLSPEGIERLIELMRRRSDRPGVQRHVEHIEGLYLDQSGQHLSPCLHAAGPLH